MSLVSEAQTSLARQAAEVLFGAYNKFFGKSPREICELSQNTDCKISIRRDPKLKSWSGRLTGCADLGFLDIVLPETNLSEEHELYVAYHELAHAFTRYEKIQKPLGEYEYWIQEAWCNNFAMAMIFSLEGTKLVGKDGYQKFFNTGADLQGEQVVLCGAFQILHSCLQNNVTDANHRFVKLARTLVESLSEKSSRK